MPRSVSEELAAKFEGIFPAGLGYFINKTPRDVAVLRISDGAPEAYRYTGLGQNIIAVKIGDAVLQFRRILDGTIVETILEGTGEEARHDGRTKVETNYQPGSSCCRSLQKIATIQPRSGWHLVSSQAGAKSSWRIGKRRRRLPVAAKTALQMAGTTTGSPGSPIPVGSSLLGTTYTSVLGVSAMRGMA
jgi:hypothetical protein